MKQNALGNAVARKVISRKGIALAQKIQREFRGASLPTMKRLARWQAASPAIAAVAVAHLSWKQL